MNTISAELVKHEFSGGIYPEINLRIDGELIAYPLNTFEFATKLRRIDRLFVFTCSCGVVGCAGWFEGIKVKYRRNTVEWKLIDPEEGNRATKIHPNYSFNRKQYEEAQAQVFRLISQIIDMKDQLGDFERGHGPEAMYDSHEEFKDAYERWLNWAQQYPYTLLTRAGRCV